MFLSLSLTSSMPLDRSLALPLHRTPPCLLSPSCLWTYQRLSISADTRSPISLSQHTGSPHSASLIWSTDLLVNDLSLLLLRMGPKGSTSPTATSRTGTDPGKRGQITLTADPRSATAEQRVKTLLPKGVFTLTPSASKR